MWAMASQFLLKLQFNHPQMATINHKSSLQEDCMESKYKKPTYLNVTEAMFICVLVICLVTYKGIQNVLFTTLTGINKSIYL